MTSFVGRLARTFSQGTNDGGHRRAVSTPEAVDVGLPHTQELKTKLSSSPSFNDFSLRTEADAAEEFGWLVPSFSMDNATAVDMDDKSTIGLMSVGSRADPFQRSGTGSSHLIPRMESVAAPVPPAGPESPARKIKRTRIMGMDAYDYCDLVRSSSM